MSKKKKIIIIAIGIGVFLVIFFFPKRLGVGCHCFGLIGTIGHESLPCKKVEPDGLVCPLGMVAIEGCYGVPICF